MPLLAEQIYFFTIVFLLFGLLFGSFFNVLIYRLPRGESVIFPASHCPVCNHNLSWLENIPILSFVFLGGKCKECKAKISFQYPLIEFVTGIYSVILFFVFSNKIHLALYGSPYDFIIIFLQYFTLLLFIPLAIIDIKHYIIPDEITVTGIILSFAVSFLPNAITPLQSFIGALCGGGFLLLAGILGKYILKRSDTMGGGDIKFLLWIGALFGFQTAFATIFIGSAIGVLISAFLILFKKLKSGNHIPFCPYLCAGVLVFVVFGDKIM
jgi:leader peptidase (prepilin peptidase)/N-methyltransferase